MPLTHADIENALRESESKFRSLAETAARGIWIFRDDRFLYCNPQVGAFTGYSPDELHSVNVLELVHPDFRELVRSRKDARVSGEAVPSHYAFKTVMRSGEERWIDFTATVVQFRGAPAILGTAFDITEAKRAEHEAEQTTAYLQALMANSPLAIVLGGADHRVRFCNPAFERLFLYTGKEAAGTDLDTLIGLPDDGEAEGFSGRVLRGESVHATTVRRRKDGTAIHVELHAIPLLSNGRFIGCCGIYQDVSERHEAEEALQRMRDRVAQVQEHERAHVARELHDNVGQRMALLGVRLAELQQKTQKSDPSVAGQIVALQKLTNDICSDIHALSRHLHPSHVQYLGLTRALSALCREFGDHHDMDVEFAHDEIADTVPFDVTICLYRVAQEALRNAQTHSGCRQVRVELASPRGAVGLRVSDPGRGFDAAARKPGRGLGFVSIAERLRILSGHLSIQSAPGQGTCIEVTIPLAADAASEQPELAAVPPLPSMK